MNPRVRRIVVLAAAAIVAMLAYNRVSKWYLSPRAAHAARIAALNADMAKFEKARNDQARVLDAIDSYVNRTLGGDIQTVDHQLRTRLDHIRMQLQIPGHNFACNTVGTGKPKDSPAKILFTGTANRTLRDERDFFEHEGTVSAVGTFDQVLHLIDAIQNEPWPKRVDRLDIKPKDNGSTFEVSLRFTTLFLPGRSPASVETDALVVSTIEGYSALARLNPFRVPPAPAVAQAQANPPKSPPAFPYDQWALTGIASSVIGPEVWLINRQTKESRTLQVGDRLNDVVLLSASGETAEFMAGLERFTVSIGKDLTQREAVRVVEMKHPPPDEPDSDFGGM